MGHAVILENLTKKIGSFTAVDNISFSVRPGEIFGFLGSNGAGKTTTIKMLCGIILPTGGRAQILGMDVVRDRDRIKQRIGYMSQKFSLYDDLSVRENLNFFCGMYGVNGDRSARIEAALAKTGLAERAGSLTGTLPFGVKQRLALASATLHRPSILFLDEPTAGVDPRGRRAFWDLIHELADEGITIFVTTHYMDEAEYCNRIALLHKGALVALGSPDELKRERMRATVLEIACDNPAAAIGVLKDAGLGEPALFANSVHLAVDDEQNDRDTAHQALSAAGIAVSAIDVVVPTLEDVFLNVLGEEGARP